MLYVLLESRMYGTDCSLHAIIHGSSLGACQILLTSDAETVMGMAEPSAKVKHAAEVQVFVDIMVPTMGSPCECKYNASGQAQ